MHITVGTTLKSGGETQFWMSLLRAIQCRSIDDFKLTEGDTPVGRSRNNLTRDFLKTKSDALLWIDSDLEFDPYHINCLREHLDTPIVAGVYPLKRRELAWCVNVIANGEPETRGPLQEVKYVGTGFMLIQRHVFDAIAKAYPELRYVDDDKTTEWMHNFWRMEVGLDSDLGKPRWLSEDWWFCEMWRRLGGKVFVDRRVTLKHYGKIAFPVDEAALQPVPGANGSVTIVCPASMQAGIQQIMDGEYEIPQLKAPVKTVLDIGSNIGGFTIWANKRWPDAQITCFEPGANNVKLWAENCRDLKGATLTRGAVTNKPGPVKLFLGDANGFLNSLVDIGHQRMDAFEEVSAIAPAALPKADFVKIDTEGSELDILQGLDLSETKGVAIEWHGQEDRQKIRAELEGRGFRMVDDRQQGPYYGVQKFIANNLAATALPDDGGQPVPALEGSAAPLEQAA